MPTPVEVVLAVRPVDDLEEALPVTPVLHPQFLLCAVPEFAVTARPPQRVNHPQILLGDELHLHTPATPISINPQVLKQLSVLFFYFCTF